MSPSPFTGRDLVALDALKAAAYTMGLHDHGDDPETLVSWAFAVADAFVAESTARWARQERGNSSERETRSVTEG
ncbi:MAG: hypothetical protein DMF84_09660 [Acidobacteria bacterium]|nr:MAG: hypothetical protein DMF84_09660 [Acidobacteriota bacterium]